ncbi:hypothetical protein CEXT_230461 [Caerostris extrusa]|uniref:Uncharacterized protein n=1 Tax=Caerostris extrusa TaxID=172846 RepID=A0AAV4U9R7_CAEEX|nr:hypothetical protein CEXT_230461 [Caerostris extrusa]
MQVLQQNGFGLVPGAFEQSRGMPSSVGNQFARFEWNVSVKRVNHSRCQTTLRLLPFSNRFLTSGYMRRPQNIGYISLFSQQPPSTRQCGRMNSHGGQTAYRPYVLFEENGTQEPEKKSKFEVVSIAVVYSTPLRQLIKTAQLAFFSKSLEGCPPRSNNSRQIPAFLHVTVPSVHPRDSPSLPVARKRLPHFSSPNNLLKVRWNILRKGPKMFHSIQYSSCSIKSAQFIWRSKVK